MSFGKVPRRWSQARYAQRAKQAGIHGNPESCNHQGAVTLIKSVEVLTKHIFTMNNRREGGEAVKQKSYQTVSALGEKCMPTQSKNAKRIGPV